MNHALIMIAAVLLFVATATCASPENSNYLSHRDFGSSLISSHAFREFKQAHNKAYASFAEEEERYDVFQRNLLAAASLSAENQHAQFGVGSPFMDMTPTEFQRHVGMMGSPVVEVSASSSSSRRALPLPTRSIDWRELGAVSPVVNMGQCSAPWAYSAIGNIEGQQFITHGNRTFVKLSEQEIIDCDTDYNGCQGGGLLSNVYFWLMLNEGGRVATAASYPTTSSPDACYMDKNNQSVVIGAVVTDFQDIPHNETAMAAWLVEFGPIELVVDASSWQLYTGGILSSKGTTQDYTALLVGYGTTTTTSSGGAAVGYWIVKNNWGTAWGEEGYIRLEFGVDACLVSSGPQSSQVQH